MSQPVETSNGSGMPEIDRRRFLLLAGALVGTAGCGSGGETPEPVALDDGQNCDQCGMVVEQHPGPVGQTYYEGDRPEDRDGPAWFCSSVCTYRYRFEATDRGWTPVVTYLTDYSSVEYTIEGETRRFISAHLDAGGFAPENALELVVESDVEGAMGPALIPFADGEDARAFADEYGGDVIDASEVSRTLLDAT